MTFEQLYAPILGAVGEEEAKEVFQNLVAFTLTQSSWKDTPNNRERAEDLLREEIEFLARYESPSRAAMLYQLYLAKSDKVVAVSETAS
jgi:hypothetical protein